MLPLSLRGPCGDLCDGSGGVCQQRGELARHYKVPEARLQLVPDSAEHILGVPSDTGILTRSGLVPGRYALCVGNQSPNKNIALAIDADEHVTRHDAPRHDVEPLDGARVRASRAQVQRVHAHREAARAAQYVFSHRVDPARDGGHAPRRWLPEPPR